MIATVHDGGRFLLVDCGFLLPGLVLDCVSARTPLRCKRSAGASPELELPSLPAALKLHRWMRSSPFLSSSSFMGFVVVATMVGIGLLVGRLGVNEDEISC